MFVVQVTDEGRDSVRDQMTLLYTEAWTDVYRYAFMLLRHREDAEDVAAEAFGRAYAAWRRGGGPAGAPLPWLLLIARRIVIDRQRRRRLIAWLPLSARRQGGDPYANAAFERAEAWLWFERVSQILPPRQREVLILRYQFDLPDEVTGRVMGLSSAGVRTLVSRALAELREHLESLQ